MKISNGINRLYRAIIKPGSAPESMEISDDCELKKYTGDEEVVVVPKGVLKIGAWAFSQNQHIRRVILPNSLKAISNDAFLHSSLEEIEIPDSVQEIEYCAFQECEKLKKVKLPSQLKKIAPGLFAGCGSLTEIEFPSGLTEIESSSLHSAFAGTGIRHLVIPKGISFVNDAFKRMCQLESVYMPDTVLFIGKEAFWGCNKLKEIRFSKNLRIIKEQAFYGCGSLEKIELPEGLLEIGNSAFGKCNNLSEVTIPSGLLKLGRWAFNETPFSKRIDMAELLNTVNAASVYQKPKGYSEFRFSDMFFYYRNTPERGALEIMGELRHERPITDSIDVYRNQNGEEILRIYVDVPTFDSDDREWDSYRKLFIFPHENQLWGLLVAGGYKIASIECYADLRSADDRTAKMMRAFIQRPN